jgi:ubiquinone/menaquinone biosynthesis C-methylase UbiE
VTAPGIPVYSDPEAYDRGTGRWSRLLAQQFVPWLGVRRDARWLDVACGTGALAGAVMDLSWPGAVTGVDRSAPYLDQARRRIVGASFERADAHHLPFPDGSFDAVVSALALPYVDDPAGMAREMVRVAATGGLVAAYAWDDELHVSRLFWDAAREVGAATPADDLRERYEITSAEALAQLFRDAGARDLQVRELLAEIAYDGFDEVWAIYASGQGHTGAFCVSLPTKRREDVREALRTRLLPARDGRIHVTARAWATRGRR